MIFDWTLEWSRSKKISTWSVPEMPSTNSAAKEWPFGPIPPPQLFLASKQTAGRGRGENKWESTADALLSSWVIEMGLAPQPVLVPMVGLAHFNAAKKIWPQLTWSLKAPNDLYIETQKVAGLLVEVVTRLPSYRVVIGLGFNIIEKPSNVPEATALEIELKKKGLSLSQEDYSKFLTSVWEEFQDAVQIGFLLIMPPNICADLKDAMNARPGLKEKVVRVTEDGSIVTRTDTHEKTVSWLEL